MRNSKLYSILVKFDRYRQNRLRKFLMSPYFNRSEVLVRLFEDYINLIIDEKPDELIPSKVWQNLKINKPFNDVRFRKYQSDLLKLIENFLAQEKFDQDHITKQKYLLESVLENQIQKLYKPTYKKLEAATEHLEERSSAYFYNRYILNSKQYDLGEAHQNRREKRPVEEIIKNLRLFAKCEEFRYTCLALSHQKIYNHDYKLPDLNESIDHSNSPTSLVIYYKMYLTQVDSSNEDHYYELKNLLKESGHIFPIYEAEFIYFSAINYCIQKVNKGNYKFRQELFDLYVDLLNKEILTSSGPLSPWHFRNIITIGLRIGRYDWVENFINEFGPKLSLQFRSNAVSFNTAQLYMYKKDFHRVVDILRHVEYEDITYNLNSKSMLIATYYELDEIEPLFSLFDSFRTYLNRHKDIAQNKRYSYINLIKFTKKLINYRDNRNKLSALLEDINNASSTRIASESWLREKIAERLVKAK